MQPTSPSLDGSVSHTFAPPDPLGAATAPGSVTGAPALPAPAARTAPTLPTASSPALARTSAATPAPALPTLPVVAPAPLDGLSDVEQSDHVPDWKQRRNRPSRRALRWFVRLILVAAAVYAAWFAWNWVMGDTFDADPATAPNAYEALDVAFTVRDPASGTQIDVRADLASGHGIARSENVAIGRRADGVFMQEGSDDWRLVEDTDVSAASPLISALDAARVMTIDNIFPPSEWASLDVVAQSAHAVDGPVFTARKEFDVAMLSEPVNPDRTFPIPRLSVELLDTAEAGVALVLEADADAIRPDILDRAVVGASGRARLEVVVDGVGVVHSVRTIDDSAAADDLLYRLTDAAIERPRPFDGTGLDDVPRATPPAAQLDLDMASREAIGPQRFERIVERTGVTLAWGNTERRNYDAVATWRDNGSQMTMNIIVSGFHRGGRDDLLAHELAHVAAFGVGIFDGSHECLADIVASHWLGHKVNMGAYDYSRCESHGDAQRVLDTYE